MRSESSKKDAVGRFDVLPDVEAEVGTLVLVLMLDGRPSGPPRLVAGCETFRISCPVPAHFGVIDCAVSKSPHANIGASACK
jgi:hypothetical protein